MNVSKIIDEIGGRKAVIAMTGLTKGRISQWVTSGDIPRPWLLLFQEKFPNINWKRLTGPTRAK